MPWRLEHRICDRGGKVNEDHAGVAGPYAWVLDGAGLGTQPRFSGFATDAAWLVHTVDRWLSEHASRYRALSALLGALEAELQTKFGPPDATDPAGGPSACLTLAQLDPTDPGIVHLAWIADTVALLPAATGCIDVITDDRVGPFEARVFDVMAREPGRGAQLSAAARAHIFRNRHCVNQPDGYAVVSPIRPWTHLVCYRTVALAPGTPLVLMSDGATRLFDTCQVMSAADVYAAAARGDGAEIVAQLREIERADADCVRYPRFKVHDDATILVVAPTSN